MAYLYGIQSERRLCEDIYCNLAYRWFCRLSPKDEVPDHSSFTTIRDRYGEAIFETVFCRIVALCKAQGLVHEECRVMTDATLIAADAATMSMVLKEPAQAQQDKKSPPGSGGPPGQPKVSNQTHHSRTDPDATLARKDRTPLQLKYKVHQTIDAESRVILDTYVTTGAVHDSQPYLEQLQRVHQRRAIHVREAVADRGYGSAAIIRCLQQQGIETYIPLWSGRVGNSKYLTGDLVYEREFDRFRCPQGKYLTPNPAVSENQKRYVSSSEDCRDCPQASTCPARTRGRSIQRFVLRSLDQDLFEEVQAKMCDPQFKQVRSERMWKSEGLFAEAKQNHNLSRAKYRGRPKVQIQAFLTAIAQNVKRLSRAILLLASSSLATQATKPNDCQPQRSRRPTFSTGPHEYLRQTAHVTRVLRWHVSLVDEFTTPLVVGDSTSSGLRRGATAESPARARRHSRRFLHAFQSSLSKR